MKIRKIINKSELEEASNSDAEFEEIKKLARMQER